MISYSINTHLEKKDLTVHRKKNVRKMEEGIIEIYPLLKKHHFYGFGGALTEASGYTLSLLSEDERKKVLNYFFNPDTPVFDYLRIPIDSSDFSLSPHSACHTMEDWNKREFDYSIEEKYIFPYLDEICQIRGKNIPLLFSPWSPPSFFKDNGSRLKGGRLEKEFYPQWAEYIALYLNHFKEKGYNLWALTIQNEPNAIQMWDSCIYTPEEEKDFFMNYLKPELAKSGLDNVKVFFWDHNKERLLGRAERFLDEKTNGIIDGIAFHGYCGDHFEAADIYRKAHHGHDVIMSEFCMSAKDKYDFKKQLSVYAHEYINDIAYGADRIIDWNFILDEKGGPNHVGNYCMAPIMKNGAKTESNMAADVIRELARGGNNSTVLQTTSFDKAVDNVAFLKDNGKITLVFKNIKHQRINVRIGEKVFSVTPDSNTLVVLSLEEKDYE